jgi:hypothetical protein
MDGGLKDVLKTASRLCSGRFRDPLQSRIARATQHRQGDDLPAVDLSLLDGDF